MDIKKIIDAALIPTAIIVIIGFMENVVRLLPIFHEMLLCILGPTIFIITMVALGWSGFRSVKDYGMGLLGGVVTGTLTGGISGLINGIMTFVFIIAGFPPIIAESDALGLALGAVAGVFSVLEIFFKFFQGLILGAILGAAGAFIASMKT